MIRYLTPSATALAFLVGMPALAAPLEIGIGIGPDISLPLQSGCSDEPFDSSNLPELKDSDENPVEIDPLDSGCGPRVLVGGRLVVDLGIPVGDKVRFMVSPGLLAAQNSGTVSWTDTSSRQYTGDRSSLFGAVVEVGALVQSRSDGIRLFARGGLSAAIGYHLHNLGPAGPKDVNWASWEAYQKREDRHCSKISSDGCLYDAEVGLSAALGGSVGAGVRGIGGGGFVQLNLSMLGVTGGSPKHYPEDVVVNGSVYAPLTVLVGTQFR